MIVQVPPNLISSISSALLAAILLGTAIAAPREPVLPAWKDGERPHADSDASPITDEASPSPEEPLGLAPPTAADIAATAPLQQVPEHFWPAYFAARPTAFLVDPQRLLSAAESREHLAFLHDHAADSLIDLYIFVFKGDQEIPGEVRAEELIERCFSTGRPAALVYYYLGAPQRTALYLSPSLTDVVSASEQRRTLENTIMQATAKVDPSSQLEAFLVQMSIRIYWMERLTGGAVLNNGGTPMAVKRTKTTGKKSATMAKLQPLIESARRFTVPAMMLGAAMVALAVLRFVVRRRTRYRFPEWPIEPRLGATHAAGVGALISFASAAVSPAAQRNQSPEDRRR